MNRGSYVTGIQHLDRCRPARRATFCLIWLSLILYGCNIFEEGKEAYQVIAEPIPSVGGQVVVNGTDPVQLLANPHENWSFSHWSGDRSEEHTSELQSRGHLVCRLLLEKKKHII